MSRHAEMLQELRGLHLPPEPPLWPPAPGWWMLTLVLIVTLCWAWPRVARSLGRVLRRRRALSDLAGIRARIPLESPQAVCAKLSILLRRTAMERFPTESVASLTGAQWLGFLERSCRGRVSFTVLGQALLRAPYRRHDDVDPQALTRLCAAWLRAVL